MMAATSRLSSERVNARVYHSPKVLARYTDHTLAPVEAAALLKHQPAFFNRDVLDIGIGTGRTTRYLAPLARRYVGIDYSPVMVGYVAAVMPEIEVRQIDMCDPACFASDCFDFVFAPNNVIDAVSHEARLQALSNWHRLLRPDGMLVLTTHNRRFRAALRGPRLSAGSIH